MPFNKFINTLNISPPPYFPSIFQIFRLLSCQIIFLIWVFSFILLTIGVIFFLILKNHLHFTSLKSKKKSYNCLIFMAFEG